MTQRRDAALVLAIAGAALATYALSLGPALRLAHVPWCAHGTPAMPTWLAITYAPIAWAQDHTPLAPLVTRYLEAWDAL